jgi:hypothetical protein
MFTNSAFIAIVFRLINFSIVIALAAYAFKKYVMPDVLLLMAKKVAEHDFLTSQQLLLENKQFEMDALIKKDKTQYELFKMKIDQWKQSIHKQDEESKQDHIKRLDTIRNKNKEKRFLREQLCLQQTVAKKIIFELSSSLPNYFQKQDKGIAYLDSIITFMNEKSL